eukprot:m51a1_g1990 hypothetical protein (118) ;mRNA; r:1192032-1192651
MSSGTHEVTRHFTVNGRVQNVMFRQTLMRAAAKRGLKAGATNSPRDKNEVKFVLVGVPGPVQELVDALASGKELNSWGAKARTVAEDTSGGIALEGHQVTTENVDSFKWRSGVEMYL